jgi:cytoskeletal protein CcmA (bactofilin family)
METIGASGKLQAAVRAREVVVLGQIKGNVEAMDRIDIRKDARLVGDIKTARIVIEDGAYFKGSIDIVKHDAKAAAPPVAQARPAVAQPSTPTPVTSTTTAL